jgi:hypothetical protein
VGSKVNVKLRRVQTVNYLPVYTYLGNNASITSQAPGSMFHLEHHRTRGGPAFGLPLYRVLEPRLNRRLGGAASPTDRSHPQSTASGGHVPRETPTEPAVRPRTDPSRRAQRSKEYAMAPDRDVPRETSAGWVGAKPPANIETRPTPASQAGRLGLSVTHYPISLIGGNALKDEFVCPFPRGPHFGILAPRARICPPTEGFVPARPCGGAPEVQSGAELPHSVTSAAGGCTVRGASARRRFRSRGVNGSCKMNLQKPPAAQESESSRAVEKGGHDHCGPPSV